jgi:hypothetical protein
MRAEYEGSLRSKTIFVIISIVIASILIDTSIIKISVYTGGIHGSNVDIMIYSIITAVYGIGQYIFLKSTIIRERFKNPRMILVHKSVVALQYILLGILALSIIQMIFTSSYSSIILKVVTWISYSMSTIFLGLLSTRFFAWFRTRRNKVVLAYGSYWHMG